jgi:hypothetical protein
MDETTGRSTMRVVLLNFEVEYQASNVFFPGREDFPTHQNFLSGTGIFSMVPRKDLEPNFRTFQKT